MVNKDLCMWNRPFQKKHAKGTKLPADAKNKGEGWDKRLLFPPPPPPSLLTCNYVPTSSPQFLLGSKLARCLFDLSAWKRKGNGCNPGEARKVEDIRKASGALGTHKLKTEIWKFSSKCLATKGICSKKIIFLCCCFSYCLKLQQNSYRGAKLSFTAHSSAHSKQTLGTNWKRADKTKEIPFL